MEGRHFNDNDNEKRKDGDENNNRKDDGNRKDENKSSSKERNPKSSKSIFAKLFKKNSESNKENKNRKVTKKESKDDINLSYTKKYGYHSIRKVRSHASVASIFSPESQIPTKENCLSSIDIVKLKKDSDLTALGKFQVLMQDPILWEAYKFVADLTLSTENTNFLEAVKPYLTVNINNNSDLTITQSEFEEIYKRFLDSNSTIPNELVNVEVGHLDLMLASIRANFDSTTAIEYLVKVAEKVAELAAKDSPKMIGTVARHFKGIEEEKVQSPNLSSINKKK